MRNKFWLPTHTGLRFDLEDPQPDQICLLDIAHHLASEARWGGALNKHYSVAEHSVRLSFLAPNRVQGRALLHDAHETWMKDIPRPIKHMFVGYEKVASRIDHLVFTKYKVDTTMAPEAHYLEKLDKCMPLAEGLHAGLHPHPESIPPLNGEEDGLEKLAEWCHRRSTEQFPDWGWPRDLARTFFINRAYQLGIWDDSIRHVQAGRWSITCNCGDQANGVGAKGRCSRCGKLYSLELPIAMPINGAAEMQ